MRYRFERPDEDLPFTGERYAPHVRDEIQHEHFHRYLYATGLCRGKDVLDAACGEGYGSALLAAVARSVVGVDNSAEAVSHAVASYGGVQNVSFEVGDVARRIPVADGSMDVVISFETLEHIDDQGTFLSECRRALRPGGVLLLSTPNREVYLGGAGTNEFHTRELSRGELEELLQGNFANVLIGGQRSEFGSMIELRSQDDVAPPLYFVRQSDNDFDVEEDLVEPTYFVALASDGDLPSLGVSALLDAGYLGGLHEAYREALTEAWEAAGAREGAAAPSPELEAARARAADLEDRVADLEEAVRMAEGRAAEAEYFAAALRQELDNVIASVSWRVTAPLRSVKQLAAMGAGARHLVVSRVVRRLRRTSVYHRMLRTRAGSALRLWALRRRAYQPFPLAPQVLDLPLSAIGEPDREVVQRVQAWFGRASAVREARELELRPRVSVLVPVFNTPVSLLRETVNSVLAQSYETWELVISDDGSSSEQLCRLLDELPGWDPRIRVTRLETNRGISAATNAALELAEGEFVAMLDHDDLLLPDALLAVVRVVNRDPDVDVVYTDQAYADASGNPQEPLLKPDWDPCLFCGVMYVGHLLVVRRSVALATGGFDSAYDNVQDFEFMLRVSERTNKIVHVPEVHYRWRRVSGSVAAGGKADANIEELQAAAVTAHLGRRGIPLAASPHPAHAHRTELAPTTPRADSSVSVLLGPVGNGPGSMWRPRLETSGGESVEVVSWSSARSLQDGIERAHGDLLLFLDGGTEPVSEDWLTQFAGFLEFSGTAAVCGVVTRTNGTIEEAGWLIEPGGGIGPALVGWDAASDGYAGSLSCARTVSLISGRCSLISRKMLASLGGLDPHYESREYAWLDLSLRIAESGLRCVVAPRVVFVRREGRPASLDAFDELLFRERWESRLQAGDPFHNPNFRPVSGGYAT